jgi:hypothetical protein
LTRFEPEEQDFDLRVYYRAACEANETSWPPVCIGRKHRARAGLGERTMSGGWRELIGHYKCGCGAVYRKTFTTTPFDIDDADCEVCGKRMDGWYNTTGFRSFELISRPGAQTL